MSHVLYDAFPGVFNRNQGGGGIAGFDKDIFTGLTVAGVDAIIGNLSLVPILGSVSLTLNGAVQYEGFDYSLAGTQITWLAGTGSAVDLDPADCLEAHYAY